MQGTIDGFNYGAFTPVAAYLMACLGAALGLRCTTRSLRGNDSRRAGWLTLGAACIGSGIWTMHFIAMIGFHVKEAPVSYDVPTTVLSLVVAIAVVGVGVFIVGYRGANRITLVTAGAVTGLGVAAMHYIGMAGMRFRGELVYDPFVVALSVVIAVVAATAALWAAVSIHGFLPSLGASMVMGVAVTGMHYTGMAGLSVHLHEGSQVSEAGSPLTSVLFPMLLGPLVFLVIACVIVMFDPMLVSGEDNGRPSSRPAPPGDAFRPSAHRHAAGSAVMHRGPRAADGRIDAALPGSPRRPGDLGSRGPYGRP
ncbi:MHYT domain-containing protein [Streptomyces sp. 549]|uniref:MHYT domain-containing protein n=1 Tax=Streptomyces sp. 549 TaxID=3049076 RepID=UPI0024C3EDF6|nr:MHYT domain-containing protein [Streptomyces sp. 549]MDK1475305.1 MHYT domain-containing protein [Streptomyces sp. 549]